MLLYTYQCIAQNTDHTGAVKYKPADRIFRITTVWFSESISCLSDV